MFEWKTGGVMFLPYRDLTGRVALIAVDEISEIYNDDFIVIKKRNGELLYSDESVTDLKNKLKGAG